MVYCSVACCTNGNHNREDLSSFIFPFDKRLTKWLKFCRKANKKFAPEAKKAKTGKPNNLRICCAHFAPESYTKTLNVGCKVNESPMPTIFKSSEEKTPRNARYESIRTKRRLKDEKHANTRKSKTCKSSLHADTDGEKFPLKWEELVVAWSDANVQDIQHDHSYCLVIEKDGIDQDSNGVLQDTEPEESKFVGCQTDITMSYLEDLEEQVKTKLKTKLSDKSKRELFLEDVLKNDDSIQFYTGVPTLGCFNVLVNLIKPGAEKLKCWNKNKDKRMKYQTSPINKNGPKRKLSVTEKFVICLVKLRPGLMGRHLVDIFSVSQAQVSRIFTTWVCFLASLFKDTLLIWPSRVQVKRNLLHSFKKNPYTRIIIDCTEVFIEKPTSPHAQRATCCQYKEHNTIKALVVITPLWILQFHV